MHYPCKQSSSEQTNHLSLSQSLSLSLSLSLTLPKSAFGRIAAENVGEAAQNITDDEGDGAAEVRTWKRNERRLTPLFS